MSNRHTQENRYDCISFGWLIQHCFPSVCYQALGVQAIGVQAVGVQAIGVDIGLLTGQVGKQRRHFDASGVSTGVSLLFVFEIVIGLMGF